MRKTQPIVAMMEIACRQNGCTRSRPAAFALVGLGGFAVQLAVLHVLAAGGTPVALAAMLAVCAALVHNFIWHSRWTWRDRQASRDAALIRFAKFIGSNGAISLAGNAVLTSTLAAYGIPVLAANTVAVLVCSAANFIAADRWVFALVALAVSAPQVTSAAEPTSEALTAWEQHVRVTETRIADQLRTASLLQRPGVPDGWARLRRGEILLVRGPGSVLPTPDALVHHWRALVFLPDVHLDAMLSELQAPTSRRWTPPDVQSMHVRPGPGSSLLVTMRIARGGIVPVTYDTTHRVHFARHTPRIASSRSISTRIVEIADAGTPRERALTSESDHGFLWRLNAYWRYVQLDEGVLVECESVSLSRDVPGLLRPIAMPIVDRVSRDSLHATMSALRSGFGSSSSRK